MKRIVERMIRQVSVGDEINLIVNGKEFDDALIEKIDEDFLIIRDKYGIPWVISIENIYAYGFEGMDIQVGFEEEKGISATINEKDYSSTEKAVAEAGQPVPESEPAYILDAKVMSSRVESSEMPHWFTVENIKKEILTILYGYPAYLSLIDDIFSDMDRLYEEDGTDYELIGMIAEKIDELEQESKEDTQSDCKSCCEIMRALLYYKLGKVKQAVAALVREEVRKPAADLARELGEKYWKAIAGYIIRYNYTDALLTEEDRQCVMYYARECQNGLDAQTLYRGADNKYLNPDLAFQGALLYLIEKRAGNLMDTDINVNDFGSILDVFADTWGPFFSEDMREQDEVLRELDSYKEKVDLKKKKETEEEKPLAPLSGVTKKEERFQYFHAPVVGSFKINTPYSQYWVDFHPMDLRSRQEMTDKDLYLHPAQVIEPLLIRHFSNLDSFDLKNERFEIVFYVGVNMKGNSAAGAFLSRESRRKVLDLYREKKKFPDLKENEIIPLSPIMPAEMEVVKNEFKNSAARCQSISNKIDNQDAFVFDFLNLVLREKIVHAEVPEPLRKDEKLGDAANEMSVEEDSDRKVICWHKLLYLAYQSKDNILIDMLEGYAIGLPGSNRYHCSFKMLSKIKRGKL